MAVAVAAPITAFAADTQTAWEGFATNTSAPPAACSTIGGTGKGDTHVSLYRPHIKSTDTPTFLSMILLRAAITFQNKDETANSQMTGSGNYGAFGINGRGKGFTYNGTFSNIVVTPSPVLATTNTVTVTGTINSFYNTPGCNVTFKGVYIKRAD